MGPKTNSASRQPEGKLASMHALLATLLILAAAPAMAAGTLERIKAKGEVTLGYGAEARPFSFEDSGGKPLGYGVELCGRVAAALKVKHRFVQVARAERLGAVAEGKIDLLCDAVIPTPASRQQVSYSIPVFATGVGAVVRTNGTARLQEILSGRPPSTRQMHTFSFVADTRVEPAVIERLRTQQLTVTTLPVKDYQAGLDALITERTDVFFGDRAILLDTVKRGPRAAELRVLDRYFTHETLALALARGDEDFRLAVDRALSRLFRADEFRALYARWFGEPAEETLSLFRMGALPE
jgi:polar amino acid transport system substrate-binding protein